MQHFAIQCVRKAIGAGRTIKRGWLGGWPDEVWWAVTGATSGITAWLSLAAQSLFSLCVLPIRIRFMPLPLLLQRLTRRPKRRRPAGPSLNVDQVARLVTGICQLRPFRSQLFPRACVRQSLLLYRALTGLGYPAVIHFGVKRAGDRITGHSWVTLDGRIVADRPSVGSFQRLYSYP
jgi:hypothetical protein